MYVVLGATGFIGMYVVKEFVEAGLEVLATGRNTKLAPLLKRLGANTIHLDITKEEDFDALPIKGVEGVILLAGLLPANATADLVTTENADKYISSNCLGTIHTLEWCRQHDIKKIISACSYGDTSGYWNSALAITEDAPRNFSFTGDHAMYVISKNAANDIIEYYSQQHGLQGAVFRLGPVYGVGPHGTILVNGKPYMSGIQTFIERAKTGRKIELWGDPSICRDIIYVKDVARAYRLAMQSGNARGLYNMVRGMSVTLEQQANVVVEIFGNGVNPSISYRPDLPNNTPSYHYEMSKARRDFGFVPTWTDFATMMLDYKKEMESGLWTPLEESASYRKE